MTWRRFSITMMSFIFQHPERIPKPSSSRRAAFSLFVKLMRVNNMFTADLEQSTHQSSYMPSEQQNEWLIHSVRKSGRRTVNIILYYFFSACKQLQRWDIFDLWEKILFHKPITYSDLTHSRSSVSILRENTKFSINFWARVVNAFHKINKIENAKRKANSTK